MSEQEKDKAKGRKVELGTSITYKKKVYGPGEVFVEDPDVADHLEARDKLLVDKRIQAAGPLQRDDGSISGISPHAQSGPNQVDPADAVNRRAEIENKVAKKDKPIAGGTSGPGVVKK